MTDERLRWTQQEAELARLRALVEGPGVGIVLHSEGVIRDANESCARMFGYASSADLIDRHIGDFIAERCLPEVFRHIRAGSEEPYRVFGRTSQNEEFPIEIRGSSVDYAGETMRRAVVIRVHEPQRPA